jgi:hypothetical protein
MSVGKIYNERGPNRASITRLASATISSVLLFSRLEGLSANARVDPSAKIAALQPLPTRLLYPISLVFDDCHRLRDVHGHSQTATQSVSNAAKTPQTTRPPTSRCTSETRQVGIVGRLSCRLCGYLPPKRQCRTAGLFGGIDAASSPFLYSCSCSCSFGADLPVPRMKACISSRVRVPSLSVSIALKIFS